MRGARIGAAPIDRAAGRAPNGCCCSSPSGAASEQLHVSYPRIELSESRARVPSFYALDLMRAATGTLPDHETLEERAREAGNATLAWPAPADPAEAIDDQEHDLAVLRQLLDDRAGSGQGACALSARAERLPAPIGRRRAGRTGRPRWSPSDGLIRVTPQTAAALAAQRLTARGLLVVGAAEVQRLSLPVRAVGDLSAAAARAARTAAAHGSADARQHLSRDPGATSSARWRRAAHAAGHDGRCSTPRVGALNDAVDARRRRGVRPAGASRRARLGRRDCRRSAATCTSGCSTSRRRRGVAAEVLRARASARCRASATRDSLRDEVTLEGGFKLRGAIDLIEEHRQTGRLRVTDHKTGRRPDRIDKTIVGGGAVLQPVLYAMAVEAGLARPVSQWTAVLLHVRRRLLRASDPAQRHDPRRRPSTCCA